MGFGHWRIAIALASAAHSMGIRAYLLDLMSFSGTPIEKSIKFLEGAYNSFSRFSQKSKAFNALIWEPITSGMNAHLDAAIQNREVSKLFKAAFEKIPKEIPMVPIRATVRRQDGKQEPLKTQNETMKEEVRLMKGNEALAHAAIRYGFDGYFGYPITPQSEDRKSVV